MNCYKLNNKNTLQSLLLTLNCYRDIVYQIYYNNYIDLGRDRLRDRDKQNGDYWLILSLDVIFSSDPEAKSDWIQSMKGLGTILNS